MEINRDEALQNMRPKLDLDTSKSTAMETFQNETLRPILKLQNPLLIKLTQSYFKKFKSPIDSYTFTAQRNMIRENIRKNHALRGSLINTITGMFTEQELSFYFERKREVNRRITNMVIKRLQDQVELIS